MPSDEEIIGWLVICPDSIEVWEGGRFELAVEWASRFVERVGLRAQIEALCSISGKDVIEIGVAIGDRLDALYARLAELEKA